MLPSGCCTLPSVKLKRLTDEGTEKEIHAEGQKTSGTLERESRGLNPRQPGLHAVAKRPRHLVITRAEQM